MTMSELQVGERVEFRIPDDHALHTTQWWPKTGPVTGTVQKVYKNGNVAVAVDQLRNLSADGLYTLHISAGYLTEWAS